MFPDQIPDGSDGSTLRLNKDNLPLELLSDSELSLGPRTNEPIDPEIQKLHEESLLKYPRLPIGPAEYVILALRRNTIGLIAIWGVVGLLVILTLALLPIYSLNLPSIAQSFGNKPSNMLAPQILAIPLLMIDALFILGGLSASKVYSENRLFLTNESIIQYVQIGLFNSSLKQVNLVKVEDVSSVQDGFIQQIFNYGSIRISTRGHKTIYTFRSVNNPDKIVSAINEAVEDAISSSAKYWGRGLEPSID